jgi:putative peptidoglycan lipid II flippase
VTWSGREPEPGRRYGEDPNLYRSARHAANQGGQPDQNWSEETQNWSDQTQNWSERTQNWSDRNWFDRDATVLLPVIPNDQTVVMPSVVPTEPIPLDAPGMYASASATVQMRPPGTVPGGPPPGVPPTGAMPPTGAAPPEESTRGVARNSAVMAAGSIVSRITGLLRTAVIGAAIGGGLVGNSYTISNTLPNMVYELLLGGVMASVIIPLLMRARLRQPDGGDAYAQRLLTLATIFLGAATVVAVAAAPLITMLFHTSNTKPAQAHLITVLSALLLPEIFFYGLAALIAAILNTRGHFAAPMWTPILNNIVVILTGGLFILLPSAKHLTPETITTAQVLVLGIGTTLGIVVQASGLIPALRRVNFRWRWRWDWRELHLRELARIASWMLLFVVVNQAALIVIFRFAQGAAGHGGPGPAIYNNAFLIFMMAHGIIAVSIMTALMPRMSAAASERRHGDLIRYLSLGTRLAAVILIPTSVAYLVLGRDLAVLLFNYGNYNLDQALQTGWVIAAAGFGLIPFAISQLQLFSFYAMPDTRTPALLNIPAALLRILFGVLIYVALPVGWIAAGLMLGNALSYIFAATVGNVLLRRRIGPLGFGPVMATLSRLGVAAGIGAVPALLVSVIVQRLLGTGHLSSLLGLVFGGAVLVGVYLAVAVALRVREVNQVFDMLRSRLSRR